MRRSERDSPDNIRQPAFGQRIALTRAGIKRCGTVHYADALQILVKWDDGGSSSLRVGRDAFTVVPLDDSTSATAA